MRMKFGAIFAVAVAALAMPAIDAGMARDNGMRSDQFQPALREIAPTHHLLIAQNQIYRAPSHGGVGPKGSGYGRGDGYHAPRRSGRNIPGWVGPAVGLGVGIISTMPPADAAPPPGGRFIDNTNLDAVEFGRQSPNRPRQRQPQSARRGGSGVPPAGETRMVPDEVVIELPTATPPQTVDALQRRFRLERLESQNLALAGTTFYRWRIPDRRSVAAVVRTLEASNSVASAQPNYVYTLQQSEREKVAPTGVKADPNATAASPILEGAISPGDPAQYALAKLRLGEAHALANGDNIMVAVIDSGIDASHPELVGAIVGAFDALTSPPKPHEHGTAIASLIAGKARLKGAAPGARILSVRAFDPDSSGAQATTFNLLKGIDWAVENRARIVNMSFAGPADPAIERSIAAARNRGVIAIAAAGNAGPNAKPLYPAAYPGVIAVAATDADDRIFRGSNRGRHIAVAAPGVDILVAIPDGGYKMLTGTSMSAAEVSGIVALMLERNPDLTPDAVRAMLTKTAKDLGPLGRDDAYGAGLTDAYRAVAEDSVRVGGAAR